jgi:hypothetical protein
VNENQFQNLEAGADNPVPAVFLDPHQAVPLNYRNNTEGSRLSIAGLTETLAGRLKREVETRKSRPAKEAA